MQSSKPSSSLTYLHLSGPPAMPTARAPLILAICPTTEPTAPEAADTTTVSPAFGCADFEQARVGGHARHAEHAERGRDRRELRIELAQPGAVRERMCVCQPARLSTMSPFGEFVIVRGRDLAHGAGFHHLVDADRLGVGRRVAHAPAHVGVEREPFGAQQHLSRARAAAREIPRGGSRMASARPRGGTQARCGGRSRAWRAPGAFSGEVDTGSP